MEPAQVAIYIAVIVIIIIILVILGFWFCGSWYSSPTIVIVDENPATTPGTTVKNVDKEVLDKLPSMNDSEISEKSDDDSFMMSGESGRDVDELVSILPSSNPDRYDEDRNSKDILSQESLEFESEEDSNEEKYKIINKDLPESSSWTN